MADLCRWFREARWGVFFHYLAWPASAEGSGPRSADEWNRRVDSLDVRALARQLGEVGAGYCFLTIGQNSGHYCSPNATYDARVGISPSKLARRDLLADLADACAAQGLRVLAYLTSGAPQYEPAAVERLQWRKGPFRLAEFQRHWEAIIREWAVRWGPKCAGWWIDGCFYADAMYRHREEPNFASLTAALKAGNPDAIVAFNPGVRMPVVRYCEFDDYTAGELTGDLPVAVWSHPGTSPWLASPISSSIDGAQYHVLNFLGDWWGQGHPRFPDELVVGYTRYVNAHGGVITWDVPIRFDGQVAEEFLSQLRQLKATTL